MTHYRQQTEREPAEPQWHGGGLIVSAAWLAIGLLTGYVVARRLLARQETRHAGPMPQVRPEVWEVSQPQPPFAATRFCPVCFAEYISDTEQCEDCGTDLVDEDSLPDSTPSIHESLVPVARVRALSGQLASQYLIANNVTSIVSQNSFWGDLLEADLYVFESDALRAKRLLRNYWTPEATPEKHPA